MPFSKTKGKKKKKRGFTCQKKMVSLPFTSPLLYAKGWTTTFEESA